MPYLLCRVIVKIKENHGIKSISRLFDKWKPTQGSLEFCEGWYLLSLWSGSTLCSPLLENTLS